MGHLPKSTKKQLHPSVGVCIIRETTARMNMDVILILQSSPRKNSKNGSSQGNSLPSNSPPRTPTFKTNSFSQPSVTQTSPASISSPIIIKASKLKFTKSFNYSHCLIFLGVLVCDHTWFLKWEMQNRICWNQSLSNMVDCNNFCKRKLERTAF